MPSNTPEYWKEYYEKNKIKIAKRKRDYYLRNRDKVLAVVRAWNAKYRKPKGNARKNSAAVQKPLRKLSGQKGKRRPRNRAPQPGKDRVQRDDHDPVV